MTINFTLPRLAPGDPLNYILGDEANSLNAEQRQQIYRELGLDRSVLQQYGDYLLGTLTFDLGDSIRFGRPVSEILVERLPWTVLMIGPAIILSALLGIVLGALAAWKRGKAGDASLLTGMIILESMPSFWIGMLLIAVFAVNLGWFPSFGAVPFTGTEGGLAYFVEVARRLVLPVTTITLATIGSNFLLTRASMLNTLGEDYVQMAEAKGLSERAVLFQHALRNALLPVYTNVTLSLGALVSGAVTVETVFAYPGVGRLLYESVLARDYPLLQGVFLLITIGVIAANVLADLTYPLLDPRARSGTRSEVS
ncbi:ABC transporter permease [Paenibacillus abyssi]|uniref:ABC transporter permease n=1 Tax=Paenibacillus abyssi TaxID=1340531 RepID=UPI001E4FAA14|nr:ABC transporter permease [Paenibacillus abyssi]